MVYDRALGQHLDHDHEQYALWDHVHDLNEVAGASEALAIQTNSLQSHKSDTGNPHKVTAEQVGKDKAQWNADRLQGVEIDDGYKRHGWALAYNGKSKKLEYFPYGDERFYEHDKLKGYKKEEHLPANERVTSQNVWTAAKTSKIIRDNIKMLQEKIDELQETAGTMVISGGKFTEKQALDLNFGEF